MNKIDLIEEARLQQIRDLFTDEGLTTIAISAQKGQGVEELKEMLAELFEEIREQEK